MNKIRLAMLISGGGTTMEAIIQACQSGRLSGIHPALVIASNPDAKGLLKAKVLGIPNLVISKKRFSDEQSFGNSLFSVCRLAEIDLIGQYGWLAKTPSNFIKSYLGKIINQHPGPLDPGRPDFGGQGMYGRNVHAARLLFAKQTSENWWTEATCHHVEKEYDTGQVIKRLRMDFNEADTPESIAKRLLGLEWECQIQALEDFIHNRVQTQTRDQPLVYPYQYDLLEACKKEAISQSQHV